MKFQDLIRRSAIYGVLVSACLFSFFALGQNISSSVKGVVVDPSGAPVPGADCLLTDQATGAALKAPSDSVGAFTFPSVLTGTYRLRVQVKGFKTLEVQSVVVVASEIRTLGSLRLELGDLVERVDVTGEIAQVQLASAEKAGLLTTQQINQIAVKGRDLFALMLTVPGVVDDFSQSREATAPTNLAGIYINGGQSVQKNYTVDGIAAMDTGSNATVHYEPNLDSISEVRIMTSNFQAEFGRNSGGVITIITKSGTQQFHGTGYDFYRHESLDANNFFNNRTGTPKSPYRYRISGYSIGGPVYIPKKFNTDRSKLFFFWSEEFTGAKSNFAPQFVNMPTAAERSGDFSHSLDVNGNLITIKDPLTGSAFPGNIIPKTRLNQLGQSMLNFFPLPNYTDSNLSNVYRWNYRSVYSGNYPRRQELIRGDWNVQPGLAIYYRYIQAKDEQVTPWSVYVNGSVNYLMDPVVYGQPGNGHVFHLTKTFTPTLVDEFTFGRDQNQLYCRYLDPAAVNRSKMGNPPQWYPDSVKSPTNYLSNEMDNIPNVVFGGQPINPVNVTLSNRPPNLWFNHVYSVSDNISKIWRSHTFKAGVYVDTSRQTGWSDSNYKGSFSFAVDPNNPYNTNDAYASAALGYITSYSETTSHVFADPRFIDVELYMQDNWRVSRRLTLDLGLRFYHDPPIYDASHSIAGFNPAQFNLAAAPVLYRPAFNAAGQRVAQDPLTGSFAPTPLIGQYVPGSGNFANGMVVGGQNGYPNGLYSLPSLSLGPRFGFAYDVFGKGKTALRGGFGTFRNRVDGNPTYSEIGNPPVAYTPTLYYGSLDTYAQGGGAVGPSNVTTLFGSAKPMTTMNYSLGLQQSVMNLIVDVSYVGSLSRHLLLGTNINRIPMYAHFDLNNADPTQPAVALPDNFLRPYKGFGNVNLNTFDGTSNYNALQASVNRRLTRGLQLGVAYTFSKALGTVSGEGSAVSPYFAPRQRNYGSLTFDRNQFFVANYMCDLPKPGQRLGWKPAGWVLDNWQISGITSFISGAPFTPGFSTTDGADITGSTEGARIDVVGNPIISKSDKTFYRNFDTSVFRRPAKGDFGNIGVNTLRGPGINNWDIAISKRFPMKSESRFLQFRTEMFNAWNHTQFSALNTTARFDAAGNQIDSTFGNFTAARNPRIIELSLKVYF
jgi:hypothetical protein